MAVDKQILLVDDDEFARRSLARSCQRLGYSVEVVSSGMEALDRLSAGSYAMLLTDVNMPGMTGDQLAAKALDMLPNLPVVFASADPSNAVLGHPPTPARSFMPKPYQLAELQARITAALGTSPDFQPAT